MTLKEWIRSLETGVHRDDLAADYKGYCNAALREICSRRSWRSMRHRTTVTMAANTNSVALPDDFKELVNEKTPIEHTASDGVLVPSDVWRREKNVRWGAWFLSSAVLKNPGNNRISLQVYLDWIGGVATLKTLNNVGAATVFTVTYYRYLPPLEKDEDDNPLTRDFPEMCKSKAKAIAFAEINDPIAEAHESIFEKKFREASATDGYAVVSGTVYRMGG